jgi:hypothetical protein
LKKKKKFVDSNYYPETELCAGAVTVSFSKYLTWQPMVFLQRSTRFLKQKQLTPALCSYIFWFYTYGTYFPV